MCGSFADLAKPQDFLTLPHFIIAVDDVFGLLAFVTVFDRRHFHGISNLCAIHVDA